MTKAIVICFCLALVATARSAQGQESDDRKESGPEYRFGKADAARLRQNGIPGFAPMRLDLNPGHFVRPEILPADAAPPATRFETSDLKGLPNTDLPPAADDTASRLPEICPRSAGLGRYLAPMRFPSTRRPEFPGWPRPINPEAVPDFKLSPFLEQLPIFRPFLEGQLAGAKLELNRNGWLSPFFSLGFERVSDVPEYSEEGKALWILANLGYGRVLRIYEDMTGMTATVSFGVLAKFKDGRRLTTKGTFAAPVFNERLYGASFELELVY